VEKVAHLLEVLPVFETIFFILRYDFTISASIIAQHRIIDGLIYAFNDLMQLAAFR
jgi:hypothetical protein